MKTLVRHVQVRPKLNLFLKRCVVFLFDIIILVYYLFNACRVCWDKYADFVNREDVPFFCIFLNILNPVIHFLGHDSKYSKHEKLTFPDSPDCFDCFYFLPSILIIFKGSAAAAFQSHIDCFWVTASTVLKSPR